MPQGTVSMWSAAGLPGSLFWSKSYQPIVRAGSPEEKKRQGQGAVVLTLFPSLLLLRRLLSPTHSAAVGWARRTRHQGSTGLGTAVLPSLCGALWQPARVGASGSEPSPGFQNCGHGA